MSFFRTPPKSGARRRPAGKQGLFPEWVCVVLALRLCSWLCSWLSPCCLGAPPIGSDLSSCPVHPPSSLLYSWLHFASAEKPALHIQPASRLAISFPLQRKVLQNSRCKNSKISQYFDESSSIFDDHLSNEHFHGREITDSFRISFQQSRASVAAGFNSAGVAEVGFEICVDRTA